MRVLVAPDKFAGTLTAVQAAEAIARGWARHAPDDVLDLAPMADGGPGFLDVLHAALGGELLAVTVRGPFGGTVPAGVLPRRRTRVRRVGAGLRAAPHRGAGAEEASTYGVGELVAAAVEPARRGGGGLGGSGTNDGGAGRWRALGATADVRARRRASRGLAGVSPGRPERGARAAWTGVRLVAASDVDNPLTGLFGATKTYGPQKGSTTTRLLSVDGLLEAFAAATDRRTSLEPGAGAAGGLGFALLALGAARQPGIDLVVDAVDLPARARAADLVVTGEGSFDFSSRAGKVPYGVAQVAADAIRPCVALAGRVLVGAREMRALGIEAAHSLVDLVGEERALAEPADALEDLAERVARSWSRPVALRRRRQRRTKPGNNPGCATIGTDVRAQRSTDHGSTRR